MSTLTFAGITPLTEYADTKLYRRYLASKTGSAFWITRPSIKAESELDKRFKANQEKFKKRSKKVNNPSIHKTNIHPIRNDVDRKMVKETMKKWITEVWMRNRPTTYEGKRIAITTKNYEFHAIWIEKTEKHKGYYRRQKTNY